MRAWILALVLLFAGCGANFDPLPCQKAALKVVWEGVYGQTKAPPTIEWVPQSLLECNRGIDGKWDGFYSPTYFHGPVEANAKCVWGLDWYDINIVQISRPDLMDSFTYHSVFSHELWHQAIFNNDPSTDGDPDHTDPGFGPKYGHPPGGAVDQADAALEAWGL